MADLQLADVTAGVMFVGLLAYVLLGGADFGGGVWDLLASGPRKTAQRAKIHDAIGPIWEANHVWLILIVVLAFSGFPKGYAGASIALHVPLSLMLLGIVLRGTAFVFRAYDRPGPTQARWGVVFSVSSVITPVLLGVILGSMAGGGLAWDEHGVYVSGFFAPWMQPFPWLVGAFALSLFALLAAAYLAVESDGPLRDDFRWRAIWAWCVCEAMGIAVWLAARSQTEYFGERLTGGPWSIPLRGVTGLVAFGAIAALLRRRVVLARTLIVLQVALIVAGYGVAQFPYLVVGQFSIRDSAAPPVTHQWLLGALAAGSVILLPSFWYLYRVIKGRRAFALIDS
jgi:cytochrome d ubiquinol oxidase subunit II